MRLELSIDPDGRRTLTLETEDMVPGMESQPWIDAWQRVGDYMALNKEMPNVR